MLQWIMFMAPQQPGAFQQLVGTMMPLILVFVIMYLLLLRPQQKKARERAEMISRIKVGDRVVTNGGIYGVVSGVKEKSLMLKIADNVEIEVIRSAVGNILAKED